MKCSHVEKVHGCLEKIYAVLLKGGMAGHEATLVARHLKLKHYDVIIAYTYIYILLHLPT